MTTIALIIVLFISIASCYEIYIVHQVKKEFDEMWPVHEETTIVENENSANTTNQNHDDLY